ncbi:MAG: AAA family ATPase [Gammaproteobacteria bacterium]|nr:AAA family ATPase [Gammaproteobacteria bacterium]
MSTTTLANLDEVAVHLRTTLENGLPQKNKPNKEIKFVLLYAYNGTGKTRLSMAFKDIGKNGDERDTLYFNAFTEDLFTWDNDLDNDAQRVLKLNKNSRFFDGLQQLAMEDRIRPLLHRYADFDFLIDYNDWTVNFLRELQDGDSTQTVDHIKVSRGEENIFVWCFFLAVAQLAIDEQEAYSWVKYIYIDDPISSLDDNNAIAVASHLAQLLSNKDNKIKVVLSSHHTLFFNVMWNELSRAKKAQPYFLSRIEASGNYTLRHTGATPFFHHVALLKDLREAADTGNLYTYHFNMLRSILEKAASFHGFNHFSACLHQDVDDADGVVYGRMINIFSHGNYSLFEPIEMLEENKRYFRKILNEFMNNYRFNPELFPAQIAEQN